MLAQAGTPGADLRRGFAELDGGRIELDGAKPWMVDLGKHIPGLGVLALRQLLQAPDGPGGDFVGQHQLNCLLHRVILEPVLNVPLQRLVVLHPPGDAEEPLVLNQLRLFQQLPAQNLKQLLIAAADDDKPVLGRVGIVRRDGVIGIAVPGGQLPGDKIPLPCLLQGGGHRVHQGHVHVLPLPGHIPGLQRHQHPDGQIHPSQDIPQGVAGTGGGVPLLARHAHHSPHGLGDDIVARSLGEGSRGAKPGDGPVNEAGVDLLERLVPQAEPVHHPRAVVLNDHIRLFRQAPEHLLPLLGFQVQGEAPFAPVQVFIIEAPPVQVGAVAAAVVPPSGGFDLDDLRAEIRQNASTVRTGQHLGQIQHSDPFQCSLVGHSSFSF